MGPSSGSFAAPHFSLFGTPVILGNGPYMCGCATREQVGDGVTDAELDRAIEAYGNAKDLDGSGWRDWMRAALASRPRDAAPVVSSETANGATEGDGVTPAMLKAAQDEWRRAPLDDTFDNLVRRIIAAALAARKGTT